MPQPARFFGRIPQKPDPRDYKLTIGWKTLVSLPRQVRLEGMPAQLNQADLGSCGPNTADEMIQFDQVIENMTAAGVSRLFIYYVTRYLMGTVDSDSGVDNRTMCKALAQFGYCPETLWPYITSQFTKKPSAAAYTAAAANKLTDYAALAVNAGQMRGCLAAGRPFMFGFTVYEGIMSDQAAETGVVPMPSGNPIGGHDITAYGYDDDAQLLRCRNHWLNQDGTPWGDSGDCLLPYAYAFDQNQVSDLWVFNTIPGGKPIPPIPPPTPPGALPPGAYTFGPGTYTVTVP